MFSVPKSKFNAWSTFAFPVANILDEALIVPTNNAAAFQNYTLVLRIYRVIKLTHRNPLSVAGVHERISGYRGECRGEFTACQKYYGKERRGAESN